MERQKRFLFSSRSRRHVESDRAEFVFKRVSNLLKASRSWSLQYSAAMGEAFGKQDFMNRLVALSWLLGQHLLQGMLEQLRCALDVSR